MEKRRQAAQPTESPAQRFQSLISRTMDLMEEILEDEQQFNRHLVKPRSDAASDQEERIYRKVDTKALKEFVAGLKELRTMLDEVNPQCVLQVDGGVDESTCALCKENGAEILVAGSAYFKAADRAAFVKKIQE